MNYFDRLQLGLVRILHNEIGLGLDGGVTSLTFSSNNER